MGDEHIDIDAALKDHPPEVIAAELAKLHNVDRDAYLKDGVTDAQFLDEMRGKSLPKTAAPAEESTISGPSNMTNVVGGGIAAIGGAIPGMGHAGINAVLNRFQPAAPVAPPAPTKQFASPSEVSSRVMEAGQPPRPQGPSDVINWASGKNESTGQYGRGYLGGTSLEHEAALHKQADALEAKNPGYKIKPGTSSLLIPEAEYNKLVGEVETAKAQAKSNLQNKAKMAAELRADRLAQINPANAPLSTKVGKVAQAAAQSPTGKRFMTGYNVADMLQAQNPFEATVSAAGAAAPYSSGLIEKVLPQKYKGLAKLLGPVVSTAAPAINYLERKLIGPQEEPVPQQAAGGLAGLQHFEDGRLAVAKKVAQRVAPSLKEAWEYGGKRLGKASEFFGNELEKAKGNKLFWLPTEADRMGGVGGPSFSANQIGRPKTYKDNTWGSAEPGTASRYANIAKNPIFGGPQSQIWSPLLGTETQHQGNQIMFNELLNRHKENIGNLSPEAIDNINNYFRSNKVKAIQNVPDFDIRDIDRLKEMGTTFPVRAAIASHGMGGVGTGGMKGQSFDYASALRNLQDPMTIGAPTHSMGPRAFQLNDVGEYRPDLNAAFPYMITGKDKGVLFNPVPKELALMDYTKLYNEVKGDPGYMGYTKGLKTDWMKANDPKAMAIYPRQEVTAPWIRELEASGFADGGEVQGYAGGKAVTGALEYIGKKILPAAEREANKAKYLENSAVKTPMYHGTSSDITEFKPKTAGTIFVTSNPRFAESFGDAHQKQMVKNVKDRMSDKEFMGIMRNGGYDNLDNVVNLGLPARQNIMPVHVNATNPFDYENPQHVEALFNELSKADGAPSTHSISHGAWDLLELPHVQAGIKNLGHDSYFVQEGGQKNLGLYQPTQLKSAIGNEGTFNPLDPDITKKEGGEVQHFENGGIALAKKVIGQVPEVAQALEAYLRGHISNAERMDILNKHLPIRKWNELPPNYTNEQIRAALMANKQPKALAEVPVGMQVGNRLDIPAYTQHGVYVDTVHNAKGSPISYNRTGHLQDVQFSSRPNQAVRVGLGTKEQALTPLGAEIGTGKSPFALMKGTNIGTSDDEVRRMMQEYLNDPNWTQIGMDPRRNSQFYDKSTGLPVFSATEKLQSGPLVMVPKGGLESSHWEDPRLLLSDFEGKHYAGGGHATPAWQRSEGKNPEGGLNAAGRASYNREHGAHLKAPQPEGGSRRDSFCARMTGMREKLTSSETAHDPDSRINKALRKWKC